MKSFIIIIFILSYWIFIVRSFDGRDDEESENLIYPAKFTAARKPKKLPWSILTVVTFPNHQCTILGSVNNRNGTCFTMKQCLKKHGTIIGQCANGFGVCCVFDVTCGGRTQQNITYFSNPGYPNAFVLPSRTSVFCDVQIVKSSDNICQMRLDFINFEFFGVQEGECLVDVFSILSTNGLTTTSSLPQICGSNSGQHVYLDFPRGSDMIEFRSIFQYLFDDPNYGRTFEIKITQIECNNELLAPPGCLQYFTDRTGSVSSFNYAGNRLVEGYPINQNYGICFRKEAGFCSIRYTADGPFQFGISDPDDPAQAGNDCSLMAADNGSRDDHLIIPGGTGVANPPSTIDRYCGGGFVPITTTSMPYVINVVSGDKFDGEVGFKLNYEQIPCQN